VLRSTIVTLCVLSLLTYRFIFQRCLTLTCSFFLRLWKGLFESGSWSRSLQGVCCIEFVGLRRFRRILKMNRSIQNFITCTVSYDFSCFERKAEIYTNDDWEAAVSEWETAASAYIHIRPAFIYTRSLNRNMQAKLNIWAAIVYVCFGSDAIIGMKYLATCPL
jgi:hypothetical protein